MAQEFVKDPKTGKWILKGSATDKTAYVSEKPPAAAKPQPKPQKNWWQQQLNHLQFEVKRVQQNPLGAVKTYAQNTAPFAGQTNDLRYEQRQLSNPATRGQRLATYGSNAVQAVLANPATAQGQMVRQAVPAAATAGGNLVRNLGGAGATIDQAEDRAYQFTGQKPPSEMGQGELALAQTKASLLSAYALGMFGGGVLDKVAPQLATRLNPATAPNLWQALLRTGVAEGLTEIPQTFFEDNTGGSALGLLDAAVGTQSDPVKPGMSHPEAMKAAFLPNAAFGALTAGALTGLGAVASSVRGRNVVDTKARQRQVLENAGLVESNAETGQAAFPVQAAEAPAPETEAAVAAVAAAQPKNWADADAEAKARLGIGEPEAAEPAQATAPEVPSQEMAPGGAVTDGKIPSVDPAGNIWDVQYDPELPEADVGLDILERLDDDELPIAIQSDDPINTAAELIESRPELDPEAGIDPGLVRADAGVLATPSAPWRSQWQALPTSELQLITNRSKELQQRLLSQSGVGVLDATKPQLIDALDSIAADGTVFLPSRMNPTETIIPVEDISVDPARFQFKQGVDAQGQQKGNSLSGVDKWNTSLESQIEVWDDPADGKTYVVNGHNRVAKARELGIPSLPAKAILAEDFVQARAAGALSNIASGGGTAFDAAKFFRDSGVTDPAALQQMGIPLQSGTGRSGIALAQLPDNIFQDAIDGKISQNKAAALGEAGLSPEAMQQAYKALQGRDMTDGTWSEVLQQARFAPQVEGAQVDLFGNTDTLNLMVQKGDLARRIRAEISSDKKLFGSVKRNAGKLEAGGNQIDAAASGGIAAKAQALLTTFDAEKYAEATAISELLNQGSLEVAAGAKPAVVARRIKQQLVQGLDQVQVPDVPAQAMDAPEAPAGPVELTSEQRQAMQLAGVQKAIANGKVRPPETPIPEIPQADVNLEKALKDLEAGDLSDDAVKLIEEEVRLREHYAEVQARAEAAQVQEMRDAVGYEQLSYEQKKALGITDGFLEDTRGQGKYFHGAAGEIELRPGGEWEGDGRNIYGDGFYATDDLVTAKKYEKKNGGDSSTRVTYEVTEKRPTKFFDLDKSASEEVLDQLRENGGYDSMRELIDTAIQEAGPGASLAEVMDEMRGYSREFNIPAYEIQEVWQGLIFNLQDQGYGGFTHVGGNLAGKGKRNHQVRIYWDPAESIELKRVKDGVAVPLPAKAVEIPAAASRKITARTDEGRIEVAAESLMSWTADAGGQPMSIDQARNLVRQKGAILDPDAIPGLDMATARTDKTKGVRNTPATDAVAAAYRQFYGVDESMPSGALASMDDIPDDLKALGGGYQPLPDWDQLNPFQQQRFGEIVQLTEDLQAEISRIAGQDVEVKVDMRRYLVDQRAKEWGGQNKPSQIGGWYNPVEDTIVINAALHQPTSRLLQTAYHESFHRMQFALLNEKEIRVLDSTMGKLKTMLGTAGQVPSGEKWALIEHQAVAFQHYAFARSIGVDPVQHMMGVYGKNTTPVQKLIGQVVSVFNKLWNGVERINNWAKGRGFQSIEDIYSRAFLGKYGEVEPDFALEYVTDGQVFRSDTVERWRKTLLSMDVSMQQLDAEMEQVRSMAAKGGC